MNYLSYISQNGQNSLRKRHHRKSLRTNKKQNEISPTVAISAQYIGDIVNSMPTLIPQKTLPA